MRTLFIPALFAVLVAAGPVLADDPVTKASNAVSALLFDNDADDAASFRVRDDGFVDITFARNTPDELYSKLLNKLQNHPDIKGVLAGRGGPTCSRF